MKQPNKFKVGIIQLSFSKNPEINLQKAVKWIEKAADKGAQVICLPELFRSQYFCHLRTLITLILLKQFRDHQLNAIGKSCKKEKSL